jgi:putative endonuclease
MAPTGSGACRPWFVYLIECGDGSYYTGIALDPGARFALHQRGKGARYTRSHPPVRLAWVGRYEDRSSALKAEYAIRRLPAAHKREMAACFQSEELAVGGGSFTADPERGSGSKAC